MNRTFKQLTAGQRYQIAILLSKGFTQKQIALDIGTSESSISRELKRNKMYSGKYDAKNDINIPFLGIKRSVKGSYLQNPSNNK